MRAILALTALLLSGLVAQAQETGLRRLDTGDDSRGWEAVGRLDIAGKGFCTGALIAPTLVLTAAHCLFDAETGRRIDATEIEFLAGWRNGRASAYRKVRRALAHPDYVFEDQPSAERVSRDVALIELEHPVRNTTIVPFETARDPMLGERIGVVSYAFDRPEAPSLQEVCDIRAAQQGILVMTCDVDFGSSGAPVFSFRGNRPQIVSVVSAKAQVQGESVSLGTSLDIPLNRLMQELQLAGDTQSQTPQSIRRLSGPGANAEGGAKFIKP
jgi:protease YdgD